MTTSSAAPVAPRGLVIANLGLLTMIFFWGSFFPVVERVLQGWDPLSATAGRHVTAALALTVVALLTERRLPFRRDLPWGRLLLLAVIGFVLSSICMSMSVELSGGVGAAVVSATNPISAAITRERREPARASRRALTSLLPRRRGHAACSGARGCSMPTRTGCRA